MNLSSEAQANLKRLDSFYQIPENCSNPQEFLRKRRALAEELFASTQGEIVVPFSAWPQRYDERGFRISPDIERTRGPDGVWYDARGFRDEIRSPKVNLKN
ncbi:MAG: hypothetical protein AABX11_01250 [Nanoarchaeota archaeon]